MKPYQCILLYTEYDMYVNSLKAEEAKGTMKIICIVPPPSYTNIPYLIPHFIDGWPTATLQQALSSSWDFLIYAGQPQTFPQILQLFRQMPNVTQEQIIPVSVFGIPFFDFNDYIRLKRKQISIISNHCWGGLTYHYLHLPFYSPFINLSVEDEDYLKLLENFEFYMRQELKYNGDEYEPILKRNYPVGRLGDVHLHFNHYLSFGEALQKWEQRKKRLHIDQLFVHMTASSKEQADRFCSLPFQNKVLFTPASYGYDCEIDMEMFLNTTPQIDLGIMANQLAIGIFRSYDCIRLLNGERDFLRFKREPV